PVGYEEHVELSAFRDRGDRLHHRHAAARRIGAFVAPAGGMIAGAENENAEMHLSPRGCHGLRSPLPGGAPVSRGSLSHCSKRRFRSRTSFAHLSSSECTRAASTAGGPPTPSMPSLAKLS